MCIVAAHRSSTKVTTSSWLVLVYVSERLSSRTSFQLQKHQSFTMHAHRLTCERALSTVLTEASHERMAPCKVNWQCQLVFAAMAIRCCSCRKSTHVYPEPRNGIKRRGGGGGVHWSTAEGGWCDGKEVQCSTRPVCTLGTCLHTSPIRHLVSLSWHLCNFRIYTHIWAPWRAVFKPSVRW